MDKNNVNRTQRFFFRFILLFLCIAIYVLIFDNIFASFISLEMRKIVFSWGLALIYEAFKTKRHDFATLVAVLTTWGFISLIIY